MHGFHVQIATHADNGSMSWRRHVKFQKMLLNLDHHFQKYRPQQKTKLQYLKKCIKTISVS